jgi:hypothetical protein
VPSQSNKMVRAENLTDRKAKEWYQSARLRCDWRRCNALAVASARQFARPTHSDSPKARAGWQCPVWLDCARPAATNSPGADHLPFFSGRHDGLRRGPADWVRRSGTSGSVDSAAGGRRRGAGRNRRSWRRNRAIPASRLLRRARYGPRCTSAPCPGRAAVR